MTANLEEIDESSALLLAETPITVGSRVRIRCKNWELRGIADSCRADQWLGFLVEIRLDADSRWSRQWFAPEHLLSFGENRLRRTA